MEHLAALLNQALDAADLLIKTGLQQPQQRHQKHERDFALNVDLEVETCVKSILASSGFPILGEEFAWQGTATQDTYWVVDPIDGTINYARGLPLCGCCIALIEHGQAKLAGISLPFLNERYWATHGQGAYLNGQSIHISDTQDMSQALVSLGDFAVGPEAEQRNVIRMALVQQMAPKVLRLRLLGSAAIQLAWLAAGRVDISLVLSNKPWDVQAGALIAREAGAQVFDLDGSEHNTASRYTLASVPSLRKSVVDIVNLSVIADVSDVNRA